MQRTSKQFDQIASQIRLRQFAEARTRLADSKEEMPLQEVALLQFMLAEEMGKLAEAADIVVSSFQKGLLLPVSRCSLLWLSDELAQRKEHRCGLKALCDLDITADDWQLCVQKSRFLALNRRFQEAFSLLRQTWPYIPADRQHQLRLSEGRLLTVLKNFDEAYSRFKKFLNPSTGHAPLYHRTIEMAILRKDWMFAKKLLDTAISLYGSSQKNRMQSAFVHFKLQRYQAAVNQANQALRLLTGTDPAVVKKQRDIQMLKCDAWLALSHPINAANDLLKHLEHDKDWTGGKLKVIDCCLLADKTVLAEEYHNRWFSEAKLTPEIATLRCRLGIKNSDADIVSKNLQILREKWPDHDLHPDLKPLTRPDQTPQQIEIVEEIIFPKVFAPKWTKRDLDTGSRFIRGLTGHFVSVQALILRESRTRFGVFKLGFFWAFIEPAVHTAIFVVIFYAMGRQSFYGMSIPLFIVTGLVPYTLFRGSFNQMASAVSSSKDILVHPKIQVLDIIVCKLGLEISTILTVFLIFVSGLYFYTSPFSIENIPAILLGFSGLAACGAGLGLITAGIASVFPGIASLIRQATILLYFTSGVFFAPEMMPAGVRNMFLAWNPLAQFISMIRNNFSPLLTFQNIEFSYAILFALTLLFIGFMFERVFHFRMLTQ